MPRAIVCTYEALYCRILDSALGALLRVEFTTQGSEVLDFAVILLLETEEGMEAVRVYDAAHGHNEMHRYTRSGGKETGKVFHRGTLRKECALRSPRSSADTAR